MDLLNETYHTKSTSILPILFTEIKHDELVNIYSRGQDKERESVSDILRAINPSFSNDWEAIKKPR